MYLSPAPVQQFWDDDANFLVGGLLFTYEASTTTKQNAFTDSTGDTALPNPIVLNARGEVAPSATGTSCGLWLDPTLEYKFVLAPADDTDPPTNPIWTVDNILSPQAAILASLDQYKATLGGVQIGSILPYGGTTAPSGWLLCYGQAVSRTTYATLFATIGTAFGAGDTTTTFNLPDLRGRVPLGKDNMGGSAANRVTNAVSGVTATTLGAVGGDQHAQADTITASSTAVTTLTDPGHPHAFSLQNNGGGPADGQATSISGGDIADGTTRNAYTNIAASTSVTTTATSALTGTSQNIPPVQVTNWIIFTAVAS
ncbi:MAG TPA: phage tail protein [Verrucomicrobiae bacterium]|nr:phage tail protein [Verrucomicrobiae bacterium]